MTYDEQYRDLVIDIITNGYSDQGEEVRTIYVDGEKAYTKSLIGKHFHFSPDALPILTTKKVAWKTAIKELLWIWQIRSNKVQDLRDMGVNIWNEWELQDGTIGKAYGYQLNKNNQYLHIKRDPNDEKFSDAHILTTQVEYLIYQLKNNPSSRRHITTLWNPDELKDMSLMPCVHSTQWHVKGGKLHLEVRARSNDMGLGNPFNVFQYAVLHRMIAQVTEYELGEYIYSMGDAHVYDRHEEPLIWQVTGDSYTLPTLKINNDTKNFYAFKIDDFELVDYKHGKQVKMEVAI